MLRIIDKDKKEDDKKINKPKINSTEIIIKSNNEKIDCYIPENENDVKDLEYITENEIFR